MRNCAKCGGEVGIGFWPEDFACPHGKPRYHVDSFTPRHDEMLSTDGLTYTSARQKQKYMDEHAIVEKKNPHSSKIARGALGAPMFIDMGKR